MPSADSATVMPAKGSQIGPIELTCAIEENHTWSNQVTMEPVESGADRTDHIVEQPYRLEITATIADIPMRSALQRAQSGMNFFTSNVLDPARDNLSTEQGSQAFAKFNAGVTHAVDFAAKFARLMSNVRGLGLAEPAFSAYEQSITALARLLQLNTSRVPFDYISPLGPMTGLVFESISVPVDTTMDLLFRAVMVEYVEEGVRRSDSLASTQEDLSGEAADVGTKTTVPIQVPKALRAVPIQIPAGL